MNVLKNNATQCNKKLKKKTKFVRNQLQKNTTKPMEIIRKILACLLKQSSVKNMS